MIQSSHIRCVHGTGGREIAFFSVVGALPVVDSFNQLWNQKIDIAVTLTMAVRRHVDRHSVDARRKIRAVIQIEAAQKILVGFAIATVLSNDQAGHHFQYFTGAQNRPILQLRCEHRALTGSRHDTGELTAGAFYNDLFEHIPRNAGRKTRGATAGNAYDQSNAAADEIIGSHCLLSATTL